MRRLWQCDNWSAYIEKGCRSGIRICADNDVNSEVKRACKEFIKWLRSQYYFPMRVPIYLKNTKQIKAMSGEMVSATFFGPFDKKQEPYIRVSVGDYEDLLIQRGKDNALAAILHSIAHELSHYFQWIKDCNITDKQRERQATYYAEQILYDYAETRDHP